MYKYKRNGFTLVELMAVIIIISLIAILTFPNIVNQIKKTKKSNNKMVEDLVLTQAKKYVSDNPSEFEDNEYCIGIDALLNNDYIKDGIVKNSDIIDKKVIFLSNDNYKLVDKDKCKVEHFEIYKDTQGNKFTKVEYLESTGTQYIDTGYYNNPNTKIDITFMYLRSNEDNYSNGMIYGSSDGDAGIPSLSLGLTKNDELYYRNADKSESFTNYLVNANQKINAILDKNNIIIDGNSYQSNMGLIKTESAYSSYLFARHNVNDQVFSKFIGRIYSCKIYDGNKLVRDYIPVLYNDKPCLFDKVGKVCYYNQGTGEFLYG